jgi:hypothetical protein
MSRQTASSKQTSSTRHTAFNTVNSDPTEYFSKPPQKLTQRNLALMAATSAEVAQTFSEDGIENVNPRSKFYQFTIDEDKESTVILPVGYPDKNYDSEEFCDDEETEHSLGFTSKGTMIQKRSPRRHENSQNKPMNSQPKDAFHGFLSGANKATDFFSGEEPKQQTPTRDFVPEYESNSNRFEDSIPETQGHFFASPKRETRRPTLNKHEQKKVQDSSPRRPSAHSLVYSASSSVQEAAREDNSWIPAAQRRNRMPQTPPTNKKVNEMRIRSQPRPARDRRLPLSPLNVMRPPNSDGKASSLKKNTSEVHGAAMYGSAMSENRQENRQHKPDPDAAWTQISTSRFEKKPDPDDFFSSSKKQVDPFDTIPTSHGPSQDPADLFDTMGSSFNSSSKEVEPFGTVVPSFCSTMKQVDPFEASLASSNASRKKVDPFETGAAVFEKPKKQVDPFDSNFRSFNDPKNERQVHPFAATNSSKQPAYIFDTQRMSFDDSSNQAECAENNSESNNEWGVDTFAPNVKPRKEPEKIVGNDDGFNHRGAWGRKAIPEDDVFEDDDEEEDFAPPRGQWGQPQVERPMGIQSFPTSMGIQSFPTAARGGSSSVNSVGSHSRSHDKYLLCSHGKPKSLCSHVEHADDESVSNDSSAASYSKPLGLPNNAIMASMIFQRHHHVDTRVVEAKIKAKEEEYKIESNRGDIPQSVNAHDEMYSCLSSFSEDTAMNETWRKPTRDLLENFARSRRTDVDFKKRIGEQRAKTAALFEA